MRGRDLTNYKIGKLTVIKFAHRKKRDDREGYRKYWLCKCDCGKLTTVVQDALVKNPPQQTCGCLRSEKSEQRFKEYNCEIKKHPKLRKWRTLRSNGIKNRTEFIRRRDGWQCRLCHYPFSKVLLWDPYFKIYPPHEFRLETHHIDNNEQNNNPRNLITLCIRCHRKIQGKNDYVPVMNMLNAGISRKAKFKDWREELFYMRMGIWNVVPDELSWHKKIRIAL